MLKVPIAEWPARVHGLTEGTVTFPSLPILDIPCRQPGKAAFILLPVLGHGLRGDGSLNFELCALISEMDRRLDTLSELNFAIELTLREAGIQIPFPQCDLHLRNTESFCEFVRMPGD